MYLAMQIVRCCSLIVQPTILSMSNLSSFQFLCPFYVSSSFVTLRINGIGAQFFFFLKNNLLLIFFAQKMLCHKLNCNLIVSHVGIM